MLPEKHKLKRLNLNNSFLFENRNKSKFGRAESK